MTYPFKYVPIGSKSEYSWIWGDATDNYKYSIINTNYDSNFANLNPGDIGYDVTKKYQYIPLNLDIWNGPNIINPERYAAYVGAINSPTLQPFNKNSASNVDDGKMVLTFNQWSNVVNIPSNIQITVLYVGGDFGAVTYVGGGAKANERVIFIADQSVNYDTHNLSLGTWGGWMAMHELGHAWGLSHKNNSSLPQSNKSNDMRMSIMWYPSDWGTTKIPLTPGMEDIDKLQNGGFILEQNKNAPAFGQSKVQDGNTTYTFTEHTIQLGQNSTIIQKDPFQIVMTLWDRAGGEGGVDTIDASAILNSVYIDLRANHFSSIGYNIGIAPTGADLNADGDPDGNTDYNVGIAAGAVTGNLADVNLASDTFHRTFPNVLDTTSVATLPDMQGSGAVRDLREAATQSTTLQSLLTQFSAATTRAGQMALIDQLLDAWADTSPTRHCERSQAIQTLLDKLLYCHWTQAF